MLFSSSLNDGRSMYPVVFIDNKRKSDGDSRHGKWSLVH